jgi:23S rRNA pseudouridine955/2504/2580 synthase
MQEIVLPHGQPATKLESFLKKRFPIGYVRKVFRKNGVRVNGRRAKPNDGLNPGDRVQLYIPFEANRENLAPAPSASMIDCLYEDESVMVIDKPAGLAVHESKSDPKRATILGILETRFHDAGVRLVLVHRLDKDTSGLLLVAKNPKTAAELQKAFETGKIEKQYIALLVGRLPNNEGKIDFPLPGREGHPVRALTRYRVVKRFSETTLVRVALETGRLHQIRLHFAKLGYPVVMDDQHGDFAFNKRFRKQYGLKRQFLHAERLALAFAGQVHKWTAPLGRDLDETLKKLSAHVS